MSWDKLLEYQQKNPGKCLKCGKVKRVRLELHHAIPYPVESKYNPLIILCKQCHIDLHKLYYKTMKDYIMMNIGSDFFLDLIQEFLGEENFKELSSEIEKST